MDELQILILAVVQGLTEFLPISSSAHLILMPHIFGWPDQGLVFDVAVHVGSLIAVLYHFRGDVVSQAQTTVSRKRAEKKAEASADDRREMDRILRKIQSDGLPSLSDKERTFLERRSQELRDRKG